VFVDPSCDTIGALGDRRSIFGGTWAEPGGYLRAALRNHGEPDIHTSVLGFRCARAAVPSDP
jgi:formylglycine-generating enzyme required for sulfatase activity